MRYHVTAFLIRDDNERVEMNWVTRGTPASAIAAVANLLTEQDYAPRDGYNTRLDHIEVVPVYWCKAPWEA